MRRRWRKETRGVAVEVVDWSFVSWLRELREEPSRAGGSMGVDQGGN